MMSFVRRLPTVALAILVFAESADAAVRKCSNPGRPGWVLMIDGKSLGDYPEASTPAADAPTRAAGEAISPTASAEMSSAARAFKAIDSSDVLAISVTCLDLLENGLPVKTGVISVITKTGAPEMLASYLNQLVAEQNAYRRAHGSFAATLDELRFFASRHSIPIEMTSNGSGWTATVRIQGITTACSVRVGDAGSGEVECSKT
jgi:hypothetical protein